MTANISRKILIISLVAATASVVTYIYLKKRKEAQKKTLPVSFI